MKQDLTDNAIDRVMTEVFRDAAVDDETIDAIVDSPSLWWGVQKRINKQLDAARSPWPPVDSIWKWLLVAVPTAAVLVIAALFAIRTYTTNNETEITAVTASTIPAVTSENRVADEPYRADETDDPKTRDSKGNKVVLSRSVTARSSKARKSVTPRSSSVSNSSAEAAVTTDATANEIRSEFIALSYARDPESGQLVRVKVPSSMMVSLGLVNTVSKPSELVDAEIVVGDDGMTRAIRFIR